MEVLYKKLYDKYNNLKTKRVSQLDDANADLEKNFQNYLTAADAYVDQLMGENEKLRTEIGDLRNEFASFRSAKDQQYEDCQKLLFEERQKNEELAKEIDMHNSNASEPSVPVCQDNSNNVDHPLCQDNSYNVDHEQLQYCRRSNDSGPCNCLFQELAESLTGMKVSVVRQSDNVGISALHQSSGYSFELIWVKKPAIEETELLYQVSSLGTFERVAPEWMRESIVFSISMCPVFFERVSRFIKHL